MRRKLAPWRTIVYLAAAFVVAVGVFGRTPFSLLVPGRALDLRDVIAVAGHAAPTTHYYMTDVGYFPHVSPFGLVAGLQPGWRIVRTAELQPSSIDDATYGRFMRAEMTDSESTAIFVAEGAAGMHRAPIPSRIRIVGIVAASHARNRLRVGDDLVGIDGHAVDTSAGLQATLERLSPGDPARVAFERAGQRRVATIDTIGIGGKARLGVDLEELSTFPPPAVRVRYEVGRVSGSSGGVMFALDIYRSFRPARHSPARAIAGTGTLDVDGVVGQIAGAMQKLIAARQAGATMFLVPIANFAEVRAVRGIDIVPIRTFSDAIRVTGGV